MAFAARGRAALQLLQLLLELLVMVLQLLDLAGEIADGFLEPVEAGHDIARRVLRAGGARSQQQARQSQHKCG